MLRNKGGFTLIELVMIIIILGILAAVAVPKYFDLRKDAANASDRGVLGAMNSGKHIFFGSFKSYPNAFSQFIETGELVNDNYWSVSPISIVCTHIGGQTKKFELSGGGGSTPPTITWDGPHT